VTNELLIGCYTPPAGTGRGVSSASLTGGGLTAGGAVADVPSPSFLALHPQRAVVYAVAEHAGRLVTLRRGDDGLSVLDDRSTGGTETCHVAVSPDLRWVAVANYGDGSLAAFAIADDGVPVGPPQVLRHSGGGPVSGRQEGPHCHQVTFDGMLLTVTDLGADRIRRYVLDGSTWVVAPGGDVVLRPGTGPRHQVVDGDLRHVVGELDGHVTSFRVDAGSGLWTELGSAATTTYDGISFPSHVVLHRGHLYIGNRGADTISVLRVEDGRPVYVGETATGGTWPRHFALVGERVVVANERSHELTVLDIPADGPVPRPSTARLGTGSPTCIVPTHSK
jgi:6-phosphogluconolactonase (cycloisomerase 2 family)